MNSKRNQVNGDQPPNKKGRTQPSPPQHHYDTVAALLRESRARIAEQAKMGNISGRHFESHATATSSDINGPRTPIGVVKTHTITSTSISKPTTSGKITKPNVTTSTSITSTSSLAPTPTLNIHHKINTDSQTSTVPDTQSDPSITLSPSSIAGIFSHTFTVNIPSPRGNSDGNSNPISGTFKQDPDTSNKQTSTTSNIPSTASNSHSPPASIKKINKDLKRMGRMRVTLHGVEDYSNDQLTCILNRMKAKSGVRISRNLVQAEVSTGIYTLPGQNNLGNDFNTGQNEEVGSLIDQKTGVTGAEIDAAIHAANMTAWLPLKPIPALIENKNIIPSDIKPQEIIFNHRAFINYSKYPIPEDVAIILSMGPKFAVPVYNSDEDFDTLRDTAYLLNEIYGHPDGKAEVRDNIEKYIKEYRHNQKAYRTKNKDYFHNALIATKRFIKNHPDVIAVQADKARASILMDKEVYINKVENLLRDANTYQPLQTTSTRGYMKMNESLLKRMVGLKMITEQQMSGAIKNEDKPANLYGLLKNHKEDSPIRPIVNTRSSMGYLAAQKITEILTTARDTGLKYNVLNSRDACTLVRRTSILPDEKLYSLDIVSMFTNITAARAISSVLKRQKQLHKSDEEMLLIVDIIKFVCIQSTEIMFNDRIYKQIKGLRMGSSLSPILADFVVEDMLDTAFLTIERPKLLIKYVDDILCVLEASMAESVHQALNSCDPHIKFEMETEADGRINYLDVTIYRDDCELKTVWFQKHISSGAFLNFHSNHPKMNIWNTAIQYVVTMILNTHADHFENILETAMDRLLRNSYPEHMAIQIIEKAKEKIIQKTMGSQFTATQDQEEEIFYTQGIGYIPKLTAKIQRDIIDSHKKNGEDRNMQIPAKPIHTMNKLVFNSHKNSNSKFNLENHEGGEDVDLTHPDPSNSN